MIAHLSSVKATEAIVRHFVFAPIGKLGMAIAFDVVFSDFNVCNFGRQNRRL